VHGAIVGAPVLVAHLQHGHIIVLRAQPPRVCALRHCSAPRAGAPVACPAPTPSLCAPYQHAPPWQSRAGDVQTKHHARRPTHLANKAGQQHTKFRPKAWRAAHVGHAGLARLALHLPAVQVAAHDHLQVLVGVRVAHPAWQGVGSGAWQVQGGACRPRWTAARAYQQDARAPALPLLFAERLGTEKMTCRRPHHNMCTHIHTHIIALLRIHIEKKGDACDAAASAGAPEHER